MPNDFDEFVSAGGRTDIVRESDEQIRTPGKVIRHVVALDVDEDSQFFGVSYECIADAASFQEVLWANGISSFPTCMFRIGYLWSC